MPLICILCYCFALLAVFVSIQLQCSLQVENSKGAAKQDLNVQEFVDGDKVFHYIQDQVRALCDLLQNYK